MKLRDLASLMGKTVQELEAELQQTNVIELKLTERSKRAQKDAGTISVLEH